MAGMVLSGCAANASGTTATAAPMATNSPITTAQPAATIAPETSLPPRENVCTSPFGYEP